MDEEIPRNEFSEPEVILQEGYKLHFRDMTTSMQFALLGGALVFWLIIISLVLTFVYGKGWITI